MPRSDVDSTWFDCVVLGAGASGLMAAWKAAERGASVLLVDKAAKAGPKVRVAGGGKGNVTNTTIGPEWYVGEHTGFCRHVLKFFNAKAALALLRSLNIPFEEREAGQLFSLVPASQLVNELVERCRENGVAFRLLCPVVSMKRLDQGLNIMLDSPEGILSVGARSVVVALGSPVWPQIGATNQGHVLARSLGHAIVPTRPILSPFVMPADWSLQGLSGISLPVRIKVRSMAFEQDLLFTHKGLSGPAALQASCFWRRGDPLSIDFLPSRTLSRLMHDPAHGKLLVRTLVQRHIPDRLADLLLPSELAQRKVAEIGKADRQRLDEAIHAHIGYPSRLEGLGKAEAAAGGVATDQINPKTLESRLLPSLFFSGEVMDVTGLLGGYNLHWAWGSGIVAGKAAARYALSRMPSSG